MLPYFVFIILVLIALFFPKVKRMDCEINSQPCSEDITQYLDKLHNSRLFFVDHRSLLAEISNQTLPFRVINIRKILPNSLSFELESLPATYKLTLPDTQESYGISSDGSFVPQSRETLTEIFVPTQVVSNDEGRVNPAFNSTIVLILDAVPKSRLIEKIVYKSPQEIQLYFLKSPMILVADPIPVYALQHLDSILYTVEQTPLESPVKEIDLRFSLPVLRTEG